MIKNENFIVVQGFMVSSLNLKGNELLVYAAIYGFSQDGENEFTGSLKYLAEWTNSTKQGVSKVLKKLVKNGLIIKKDKFVNNVKFCKYSVNLSLKNELTVYNKVDGGIQQSCIGGMQQSLPNNISIDNIDNNIKNIKKDFSNDFLKFWEIYDKKVGNKEKIAKKFDKLKDLEKSKIFETLPLYVSATPDKSFRKNPETYLNNKSWEDEIITKNKYENKQQMADAHLAGAEEFGKSTI